jgi:Flp pilus assembly protein TadB
VPLKDIDAMRSVESLIFLMTSVIAAILILGVELTLAAPKVAGAIAVVSFALILVPWLFRRLKRSRVFGA